MVILALGAFVLMFFALADGTFVSPLLLGASARDLWTLGGALTQLLNYSPVRRQPQFVRVNAISVTP